MDNFDTPPLGPSRGWDHTAAPALGPDHRGHGAIPLQIMNQNKEIMVVPHQYLNAHQRLSFDQQAKHIHAGHSWYADGHRIRVLP